MKIKRTSKTLAGVLIPALVVTFAAVSPVDAGGSTPTSIPSNAAVKTKAFVPATSASVKAAEAKPMVKQVDFSGNAIDLGNGRTLVYSALYDSEAKLKIINNSTGNIQSIDPGTAWNFGKGKISSNKKYFAFQSGPSSIKILDLKALTPPVEIPISYRASVKNSSHSILDFAVGDTGNLYVLDKEFTTKSFGCPKPSSGQTFIGCDPAVIEVFQRNWVQAFSMKGKKLSSVSFNPTQNSNVQDQGKEGIYASLDLRGKTVFAYGNYQDSDPAPLGFKLSAVIQRFQLPSINTLKLGDYKKFSDTNVYGLSMASNGNYITAASAEGKGLTLLTLGASAQDDKADSNTGASGFLMLGQGINSNTVDTAKNRLLTLGSVYANNKNTPSLAVTDLNTKKSKTVSLLSLLEQAGIQLNRPTSSPQPQILGFSFDSKTRIFTLSLRDSLNGKTTHSLITGNLDRDILSKVL